MSTDANITPDTDSDDAAADVAEPVAEPVAEAAAEAPAEAPAPVAAEVPAAPPAPVDPPKPNKSGKVFTEAERAARKQRVARAKDAMARSVGMKGDHVVAGRAALKAYLQRLNDPNQPDDARFEMLVEAPFRQPPKKRTNDRRF